MKKSIFAIATVAAVLLTGCNNQKQDTSSKKSSIESSKVTHHNKKSKPKIDKRFSNDQNLNRPKKVNDNTKMDFAKIQQGDYSSLMGNWQLVKAMGRHQDVTDTATDTLTVTPNSIKTSAITLTTAGLKDSNGSQKVKFAQKTSSLTALLEDESVAINWAVYFYPAGSTDFTIDGEKQAPPTKNTIVVWTSNDNYSEVYEETSTK